MSDQESVEFCLTTSCCPLLAVAYNHMILKVCVQSHCFTHYYFLCCS